MFGFPQAGAAAAGGVQRSGAAAAPFAPISNRGVPEAPPSPCGFAQQFGAILPPGPAAPAPFGEEMMLLEAGGGREVAPDLPSGNSSVIDMESARGEDRDEARRGLRSSSHPRPPRASSFLQRQAGRDAQQ